jgi:hypothetical protein
MATPLPKLAKNTFLVVRTSGEEEVHTYEKDKDLLPLIRKALKFSGFDFVRVGKAIGNPFLTMLVDDVGYEFTTVERAPGHWENVPTKAKKPTNKKATEWYHAICIPGTTHAIVGDVAIFQDS